MTTYTGPTPQERQLAQADFLLIRPGEPTGDNWALGFEYGWARGHRIAKAEDAPLLELAQNLADTYVCQTPNCICIGGTEELCNGARAIAAIALAEGRE